MKRWLPAPLLSLALFAGWLLLNRSLSSGHLLIGALAALLLPLLTAPLRPAPPPVKRPLVLARLILLVGWDVIVSAVQVMRGIVGARRRPPRAFFVAIPLDVREPHALAALSIITTVVPGTVWTELARDRSVLLLHVFDVAGEEEFVRHFKERYELPLKEIFE